MLLPWDEIQEGPTDQRRVFAVRSDVVRSQATGKAFTVDRLLAPDWVNVVALTPDDEVLFVRQWRFGTRALTLEVPAGLVEAGEDALAAGLRELREETGYAPDERADAPSIIGRVSPNPAFMGNTCSTVFVPCAREVGALEPDPMEELEVVKIPARQIEEKLRAGELSTALGIVALTWWRLHRPQRR